MIVARRVRPRKTIDDFMALPEGIRAELIDGELFMSPAPKSLHQRVVGRLFHLLYERVGTKALGEVFVAPLDVHLPSGDIVQPDILFVAKSNQGIIQDWIRGAPDLVIEVLSTEGAERDRLVKRDLYAQNGIREYWIVDPASQTLEVFSPAGNCYEPNGYFDRDDIIVSPLLPEFRISLSDLFA